MARIRSIKPEFFDDEDLAALSFAHRLCFAGLWTQADKAGRMEDRPARLKVRIFPFDTVNMDELLADLVRAGFLVRYEVSGRKYLAIRSWTRHQRPRDDENDSVIPAPPTVGDTRPLQRSDGGVTVESLGKEGKGRGDRKGTEGSAEAARGSAPPSDASRGSSETREADDSPIALTFPTVGADGPTWALRDRLVAELQEAYPGVDILAEARQALVWVQVNTERRKTGRGMPKFLLRWVARSVNRGTAIRGASAPVAVEPEIDWYEQCKQLHAGACEGRMRHHHRMLIDASRQPAAVAS